MARIHLFELEDQAWCLKFIREATTDYLTVLYQLLDMYAPAFEKICEILDKTKVDTVIDCCSGSGGPIKKFREYLDKNNKSSVSITLTDKYPNVARFKYLAADYPGQVYGHEQPVDASQFPIGMKGMRTFFSSFHHFTPELAKKILQDAVNNNVPIGIFECTQRAPVDFLRVLLSPLLMWLFMPFSKRLNWQKLVFTYLIPLTPLTNMWDYFVSNLRTYSPIEMQELLQQIDAPDYKWEVGKLNSKKAKTKITYLVGYSTKSV